jgi:glycosyltransferase involved in cell wall biosynthesis
VKPWPTLTIVTPTFNAGRYLAETIESVLNQDVPGIEYIIVDGGSTDDTVDVIRKYEKHLAWWTSGPDGGQANAVNAAFARAKGEFLAEHDADDIFLPGALHFVLDTIRDTPGARWVAGGVLGFGTADEPRHEWHMPVVPRTLLDLVSYRFQAATPGHFYSRDAVRAVGGYDPTYRYLFDFEFFARLLVNGERCIPLHRPIAAYRFHPTSKTVAEIDHFAAEWDRIRDTYMPMLPFHQQLIARHRIANIRAGAEYTRAARALAEGNADEARDRFGKAFTSYPPSLITRNGLGCARRLFFGGA